MLYKTTVLRMTVAAIHRLELSLHSNEGRAELKKKWLTQNEFEIGKGWIKTAMAMDKLQLGLE